MTLPRRRFGLRAAGRDGPAAGPGGAGPVPEVAVEAYHIDNVIHGVRPNALTHQHEHITKVLVTEAPRC